MAGLTILIFSSWTSCKCMRKKYLLYYIYLKSIENEWQTSYLYKTPKIVEDWEVSILRNPKCMQNIGAMWTFSYLGGIMTSKPLKIWWQNIANSFQNSWICFFISVYCQLINDLYLQLWHNASRLCLHDCYWIGNGKYLSSHPQFNVFIWYHQSKFSF